MARLVSGYCEGEPRVYCPPHAKSHGAGDLWCPIERGSGEALLCRELTGFAVLPDLAMSEVVVRNLEE